MDFRLSPKTLSLLEEDEFDWTPPESKKVSNFESTLWFFNSPKKRTKSFCFSRLGQKLISFFGRIEDTIISFRD